MLFDENLDCPLPVTMLWTHRSRIQFDWLVSQLQSGGYSWFGIDDPVLASHPKQEQDKDKIVGIAILEKGAGSHEAGKKLAVCSDSSLQDKELLTFIGSEAVYNELFRRQESAG